MSEFIGLSQVELEKIQEELRESLNQKMQELLNDVHEQPMDDAFDLVSIMAGKESIALQTSIDFTQKIIEANNKKIADIMQSRDTLVLQAAIDFVQRAIEANNKKIFEYIEKKFNSK